MHLAPSRWQWQPIRSSAFELAGMFLHLSLFTGSDSVKQAAPFNFPYSSSEIRIALAYCLVDRYIHFGSVSGRSVRQPGQDREIAAIAVFLFGSLPAFCQLSVVSRQLPAYLELTPKNSQLRTFPLCITAFSPENIALRILMI